MDHPSNQPIELLHIEPGVEPKPQLLLQNDSFKLMRLVLPAGKSIPEHKAPKEITVDCLAGAIDFTTRHETHRMTTGMLLHLDAGELHSLTAIEDAIVLVTLAK
ncbi:cupin domain-containing protein [Stieleria varia]|uniref:Cupin domain protein n=1 Tax=Stieleria varia TaxID=2528005 RepID=A0A5C6B971_9BACT|nr:cupin domain-containing protein [Stieleria varia]TWU08510.1 Cupin domain protein [Stieleria varia]